MQTYGCVNKLLKVSAKHCQISAGSLSLSESVFVCVCVCVCIYGCVRVIVCV